MHRLFVGANRRGRNACVAFGLATALTLGFSGSASADDIACHRTEKPEVKAADSAPARGGIVMPRVAPTPEELARLLANVQVVRGTAACPAIDEPAAVTGVKAFVDPETGQLREPTADDWASLRANQPSRFEKQARSAAATQVFALGGGVAEVAGPDGLTEMSVQIGRDGSPILLCSPTAHTPAPAPAREKAKE
jgi:hypothetical protein